MVRFVESKRHVSKTSIEREFGRERRELGGERKPTHAIEVVADAHADELYHVGVPASRKRANLSAHELGEVREGGVTGRAHGLDGNAGAAPRASIGL